MLESPTAVINSLCSAYDIANIDMTCNVKKTVCMIFEARDRSKIMSVVFPQFSLDGNLLEYVQAFKYLGHMISNTLSDDVDIKREIRNMFTRTNILACRFAKC